MSKMPVRQNFDPTAKELKIRQAVHVLQDATNDAVVLEQALGVYLIPDILGPGMESIEWTDRKGNTKKVGRPAGTVEYNVSDGLADERSYCSSFYSFDEARAFFDEVVEAGGFKSYFKSQKKKRFEDGAIVQPVV